MIFQQIQEFIELESRAGNEVHLLLTEKSQAVTSKHAFLSKLLPEVTIKRIVAPEPEQLWGPLLQSNTYQDCYFLDSPHDVPFFHIAEVWEKTLGFETPPSLKTAPRLPADLPKKSERAIAKFKNKYKKIVGLQLWTDTDARRSWSPEHASRLARLCRTEDILIINLTPHPFGKLEAIPDFGYLALHELFALIGRLDAIAAIDSCCGHIAAVLGIPNLTIWSYNSPFHFTTGNFVASSSFRTLRCNYSLYHASNDSSKIYPELVFERLKRILSGDIALKRERITAEDTLNGVHIERVEAV
ncbi:glycosyltransferase family 9 protein [Cohnella soli]|uniref:Glycosyltransferase family 9 protein n=1 Tax=Cohnella soli TaxID=425005 RepID=A0ABW0I447_9BACL